MPLPTSDDRYFRTDHLEADIKRSSIRGGAVTTTAQFCKFVLNTSTTMLLARLLTPQDYGLIGMVTAITGLIIILEDLGLSAATVQSAELNHRQVTVLFWLNLGVGALLAVLLACAAPAIAWFYREPRLTLIAVWLAPGFVLSGAAAQHGALLKRQMRFAVLAAVEISALVIGIITGVICAWRGAGYWALISIQLTTGLASVAGYWIGCRWRPGVPSGISGVRSLLRFGGNLAGFQFTNYIGRNLDNVLIGRYWGPTQLGYYARAYNLLTLPLAQINGPTTTVMLSALSRVCKDPERFRRAFLRYLSTITCVTIPLVVFCIAMCDEIIGVVLGAQWNGAVPIFRALGIAGLVQVITSPCGILLIASGRTNRMFRLGVTTTLVTVIAFIIGLPLGALGVAVSYAVYAWLAAVPIIAYTCALTAVNVADIGKAVVKPAAIACAVGLVLIVLRLVWPQEHRLLLHLLVAGLLAFATWGALVCLPACDEINPFKFFSSGFFHSRQEAPTDG